MKIALMSGAYVNAGDFLIEQRSRRILEKNIAHAEVQIYKRNIPYDNQIEELNKSDVIVFGGGPGFQNEIYPTKMPFVSDLHKLKTPIAIMGWGWKGKSIFEKDIYKMSLNEKMKDFLKYAEEVGIPLGCRDWYTVRFLKNQGFEKTVMTGCPAWYDLEHIENLHSNKENMKKSNLNICISDAAFRFNKMHMKPVVTFIRKKFPDARIQLIFHRGITKEDKYLIEQNFLKEYNLEYQDISGSVDGFKVYESCDLHIGFRVHAHIYNLSRGNISILLNEDARGNGVNDALGLTNIDLNMTRNCMHQNMGQLIRSIDDYLQYIAETDYLQYDNACNRLQFYYGNMKNYIKQIEKYA